MNVVRTAVLRRRALLASIVLIAIVALEIALVGLLAGRSRHVSDAVNDSGRQRSRSQRIALFVEKLHAGTATENDRALLRATIAEFEATRTHLLADAETLVGERGSDGLTPTAREGVRYQAAAERVLRDPHDGGAYAEVQALRDPLLARFEAVTNARAARASAAIVALQTAALAGALVCVALGALYWLAFLNPVLRGYEHGQRALAASRSRFRSLFEFAADPAAVYDTQGNLVEGNRAAAELFGYRRGKLAGASYTVHVAPDCHDEVAGNLAIALAGRAVEFETVFVGADGRRIDVLASLSPIVVDGTVEGVFGTAKDLTALRAAEAALVHSSERFRSLFEQQADPVIVLDEQRRCVAVNVAFERVTGFPAETVIGKPLDVVMLPETLAAVHEQMDRVAAGEAAAFRSRIRCNSGVVLQVDVRAVPIIAAGRVEGAYAIVRDVTEREQLRARGDLLAQRTRDLYLVASSAGKSAAEQIVDALRLGCESLGLLCGFVCEVREGMMTVRYAYNPPGSLPVGFSAPLEETLSRFAFASSEVVAVEDLRTGTWAGDPLNVTYPWRSAIATGVTVGGRDYGTLVLFDVDPHAESWTSEDRDFVRLMSALAGSAVERGLQQERLDHLARHDQLTDLPNRVLLGERLRQAISAARRYGQGVALHYLDLDGFKAVNDGLGHLAGDALLRLVAQRLTETLRASDTIARVGGDEFVILQPHARSRDDAETLASHVIAAMTRPFAIDGTEVRIGTSIGVALLEDGVDAGTLFARADAALYRAKNAGKNGYAVAQTS
ncbi:hypothetical protein WPS_19500 [Vulcanimicrobium alpinum]|uniref:Diguanylate cyclase n=1 Tax=Vulcanimicrobium alpinum TaxID=3016050 RepID=A0AAN2C9U4_UNVUL|nr:diguanylate cyclase [Vulcanimicrobium alpinum]BDE06674.1 hypothetical protein WPS_19500 [Vulcanimicrobium alpinum]